MMMCVKVITFQVIDWEVNVWLEICAQSVITKKWRCDVTLCFFREWRPDYDHIPATMDPISNMNSSKTYRCKYE